MEQNSNNTLEYKHISVPTEEIIKYIDNRRKGITEVLKTRWKKLNSSICGGLEKHMLITIAGNSGSGKSSMANNLETDIIYMNPNKDFVILNFSFEMLGSRNIGRKLSYHLRKTTSELYSGLDDAVLTDDDFSKVVTVSERIKNYPVYYVDTAGTVEEINNTIIKFLKEDFVKGKWVVIFLDHVLLTSGKTGESERSTIVDLQKMFIRIKKKHDITIIQLAQLNREIEQPERIKNPQLHFPNRADIFASDK